MTHDPHFQSEHQEASWISMTDLFLLTAVLLIAGICQLGLGISRKEQKVQSLLVQSETNATRAREVAAQLAAALAEVSRLSPLAEMSEAAAAAQHVVEELRGRLQELEGKSATGKITVDELERRIAALKESAKQAELLTIDLGKAKTERQRLLNEIARLTAELQAASTERQRLAPEIQTLRAELAAAVAKNADLVIFANQASESRDRSDAAFALYRSSQGALSQELLGFNGKMDRVVFIFDGSGSMKDDGRWEHTRATMRAWLRALPVREAAVIVFNDTVRTVPEGDQLLPLTAANLKMLEEALEKTSPDGNTNTLAALERAYTFAPIDAIVLVTDGKPEDPGKVKRFVKSIRKRYPDTRIHAVALGEYFDKDFGGLLKDIAAETGGAFIGR